ncbi:unnamed protein product [Moneuplotes crassus]|uniref:BZIP domain-containing protein n=1 Tax=Euplotes crassus TaxID=5936 RepID=A0AAD1UQX1_EUPCR|nr:unnamed protein product [Moneuplotes crassus]
MSEPMKKRMKKEEGKEEILENTAGISGKERAKLHRERKKKYYQSLEKENATMKIEIKELKERLEVYEKETLRPKSIQNDDLVDRISMVSRLSQSETAKLEKLHKEDQYALKSLPKMYRKDESTVKYSSIENTKDTRGAFGSERVELLRELFKSFLENILPLENKGALYLFDKIPLARCIRAMKHDRNKFANGKTITGNEIVDKILNTKMSKNFLEFSKNHGKRHQKLVSEIRRLVKSLVKVRNKIFNCLNELQNFRINMKNAEEVSFSKEDQIKLFEMFSELEKEGCFDIHTIWQLEKKQGEEYRDEAELSE